MKQVASRASMKRVAEVKKEEYLSTEMRRN
jgi:hypothetical protein